MAGHPLLPLFQKRVGVNPDQIPIIQRLGNADLQFLVEVVLFGCEVEARHGVISYRHFLVAHPQAMRP